MQLGARWWRCRLRQAVGVKDRFIIHGLRRTFVDLARRAQVDAVVTRSLTGHVTMKMHLHYSTVGLDEKRIAAATIAALLQGGDRGGEQTAGGTTAG